MILQHESSDFTMIQAPPDQLLDPRPAVTARNAAEVIAPPLPGSERLFNVLGVNITDATQERAIELMRERMLKRERGCGAINIVNAHTLNVATSQPAYREVLNSADYVFGDGTGVRWAARLQGLRLQANLVGTDLIPRFFEALAHQGFSYFMLGADPDAVVRAAGYVRANFPGWHAAGFHHGYLREPGVLSGAIEQINAAHPDLLLVAMGNPLQETWIARHRHELNVGLAVGVGGLFDIWAGNLQRPSRLFRDRGCEWLGILLQQPHKAGRYLLGNPLFLSRIGCEAAQRWLNPAR